MTFGNHLFDLFGAVNDMSDRRRPRKLSANTKPMSSDITDLERRAMEQVRRAHVKGAGVSNPSFRSMQRSRVNSCDETLRYQRHRDRVLSRHIYVMQLLGKEILSADD